MFLCQIYTPFGVPLIDASCLSCPCHVWVLQVLVWSGPTSTADGARCKAALLAAHSMSMPEGADGNHCTRIVYLVDPVRYDGQLLLGC